MSKPLDPEKIADFLGETRDEAPADVQHVFLTLEDLWERKLWHQLTETLLEYYAAPESEPQRLPMYNTFILSFADKINQLKLVTLGLSASQQLKGERYCNTILAAGTDHLYRSQREEPIPCQARRKSE